MSLLKDEISAHVSRYGFSGYGHVFAGLVLLGVSAGVFCDIGGMKYPGHEDNHYLGGHDAVVAALTFAAAVFFIISAYQHYKSEKAIDDDSMKKHEGQTMRARTAGIAALGLLSLYGIIAGVVTLSYSLDGFDNISHIGFGEDPTTSEKAKFFSLYVAFMVPAILALYKPASKACEKVATWVSNLRQPSSSPGNAHYHTLRNN